LKAAFSFYDKDKSGKIDINELREICLQFNLPVQNEILEMLLECCDVNNDQKIDYVEFSNFLNWKDKMPSGFQKEEEIQQKENQTSTSESSLYEDKIIAAAKNSQLLVDAAGSGTLSKQIDKSRSDYKTSASMINGDARTNFTKDLSPYGIPTIRSDLPAPRIRRIGDNTNYGDESDSYGLINPSIYSNFGVYEEDFFKSRDETDIRRIFDSIGVEMTNEVFQQIWNKAKESASEGQVSVETFRNVLDERIANEYEKVNNNNDNESNDLHHVTQRMTNNNPSLYDQFHQKKEIPQKEVLAS